MGAQRHVNRHAGAHIVTQHFDDFTDRFSASGRALGQLHDHYEAHSRAHHLFRWDQDVKAQTAVVRYDKAHAGIGEIATDNLAGFGTRMRTTRASRRPLRSAPSGCARI